jgi:hypothetical protein
VYVQIAILTGAPPAFARQDTQPLSRVGDGLRIQAAREPVTDEVTLSDAAASASTSLTTRGYLDDLGTYLERLGARVKSLSSKLTNGFLSATQEGALQEELKSLNDEFNQLRGDDRLTQAQMLLTPGSGASGDGAVLGERFQNLLGSGDLYSLTTLRSALADISTVSLTDAGAGDVLLKAGKAITSALRNGVTPTVTVAEEVAPVEKETPLALETEESSYALGSSLALTVRSLDARGMIQAAASGLDQSLVSQLILEPPKPRDHEDKKNDDEEEQKPVTPLFSSDLQETQELSAAEE